MTFVPMAIVMSGLMRNRQVVRLEVEALRYIVGGWRSRTTISVQVTGRHFPARM